MHAFFCFCSLLLVFFAYPETMGVPLEEMDEIFGELGAPVPQGDDEADEENQPLQERRSSEEDTRDIDVPVRPLRRSISSHPRFLSSEERDARLAALKVAQQEQRSKSWLGNTASGARRGLRNLFGSGPSSDGLNRTEYTPVNREEH